MYTTNLRKVGGSIMLAVPPALLQALQLRPGATVDLAVDKGRLVVEPQKRPKYTLTQLLSKCDKKARRSKDELTWVTDNALGRELI